MANKRSITRALRLSPSNNRHIHMLQSGDPLLGRPICLSTSPKDSLFHRECLPDHLFPFFVNEPHDEFNFVFGNTRIGGEG